ncbi:hypothetical protein SVA_3473 [Sulfurifustis variabilis]|uniref:SHOCT domain-containing protein n=1 Tax=Sulfurifustis variabilis TaxID=1675686 RepID=A0A1B4V8Z6_9GAMM|nr:SHOCT domain-containing protein [Sulfurifustis variabilis]BAU50009.1 hypothetical protein SVA_3473 [Sulfurifustis variabilis]
MMRTGMVMATGAAMVLALAGCSSKTGTAAAVGVGAAGAAYEYSNKRAMDELKEQRDSGQISQEEFNRRKQEIEGRSAVY